MKEPNRTPSKEFTKSVQRKPRPEPSLATIGKINVSNLRSINPQRTPVSSYVKKV